jgi:shikimate dehydrogenase
VIDRYAVIGNPVAHSKSPLIHTEFARQTGQELTYATLLAPLDGFVGAVRAFAGAGGRGLNVTLPFKLQAHDLADSLSERARAAGAVNTLKFDAQGVTGDNTDGVGLMRDIENNLHFSLTGRRILVLGAGGAARGIILPLMSGAPASITIANRSLARAEEMATAFAPAMTIETLSFEQLQGRRFDVVINATSASLSGSALPVTQAIFSDDALAYDLMYGHGPMPFLTLAKAAGARTADGLGMLVEQAAESFFIWRGVRPNTAPVQRLVRQHGT